MSALDEGMERLADILKAFLEGHLTNNAAGNAVMLELADLEESHDKVPHESPKGRLFRRAFWAAEQLREPPKYRTHVDEIRYLLQCLRGEDTYEEERANAFCESGKG